MRRFHTVCECAPAAKATVALGLALLCLHGATRAQKPQTEWPVLIENDFAVPPDQWSSFAGTWNHRAGAFVGESPATTNAVAYHRDAPISDHVEIEADLTVGTRLLQTGWVFAGVTICLDPANLWMLALTEGPDGERYVDFLESHESQWQAQTVEGDTLLEKTADENKYMDWQRDTRYRLRLTLTSDGIEGTVLDPASGKQLAHAGYAFGDARAVRLGMPALMLRGCTASYDRVAIRGKATGNGGKTDMNTEAGPRGNVAMLRDDLPGYDNAVADALASALRKAGFGVTFISARQATDPAVLSPSRFFMYAVPNACTYPADGEQALMTYLRRRGHLMLLGAPAFTNPTWEVDGKWVDKDAIAVARKAQRPATTLFAPTSDAVFAEWVLATNDRTIPARIGVDPTGAENGGPCMAIHIQQLTGWTTFASPDIDGLFSKGHDLLCFRAKADPGTDRIAVEINEEDGSRWIATAPLTAEWSPVVLSVDDFAYWPDSKTKDTRGGPGDKLHPGKARRLILGLAHSHTGRMGDGPHAIWVDKIGTAHDPFGHVDARSKGTLLPLESVYPSYKTYPLANIASMHVAGGQQIAPGDIPIPATDDAFSAIGRPRGKGFGNNRKWRWVPLVHAFDAQGDERGTPVWMLLNNAFPFAGSVFVSAGINDNAVLTSQSLVSRLAAAAYRLSTGLLFEEAGSHHFAYWPDEPCELGAAVINPTRAALEASVRFTVTRSDGAVRYTTTRPIALAPGRRGTVSFEWDPPDAPERTYTAAVDLLNDAGDVIDTISHEIGVLRTEPVDARDYVTVRGQHFYLRGQQWFPVGVNFWPLYCAGLDPGDYSGGWNAPGFYDPEDTERDLERIAALGINMVSIQLRGLDCLRNTLDFMRRCDRHRIKVMGYVGGASPLDLHENELREYIEAGRLAENATLFAYDTIWEPGNWVYRADNRDKWDSDWEAWIAERYGSVSNAESDWGFPVPRRNGNATSPSDRQLREDGPWHVMVAAYRRFMDDFASAKWNRAHRALRRIDPNHLVTFRQGNTLPQDFTFTATPKHIDFICPEGYAIRMGEDGDNTAGFITRYVAHTTRGKPVVWSEFGVSIWDQDAMAVKPSAIPYQRDYHDMFYRMVLESHANGTVPWWWPGGYRVNERSDFGICNPDGTPRPSADLIAKYADAIKRPRQFSEPDTWFVIDREAHPGGYCHVVFSDGKDAYGAAVANGKTLGVKTAGTGTDSRTCPLVAVGNRPCTGSNPPKYLDAEFNWLQIRAANGTWVEAMDGAEIHVPADKPIRARVSVGNIQEATWLALGGNGVETGAVYLVSTPDSDLSVQVPVPADTPYLADADFGEVVLSAGVAHSARVELHMSARQRATFGEKRTFRLVPKR